MNMVFLLLFQTYRFPKIQQGTVAGVMQYLIMSRWLIIKYFKEKQVDIQPSNAPCVRKPILPGSVCWITVIIDIFIR